MDWPAVGIESDTTTGIETVLSAEWSITDGMVVPTTDGVTLKNGGRRIEATYLYADLADSSWLAQNVKDEIAAKVVRSYLNAATRLLRYYHGEIRSFDGDRVMAIFIGNSKNSDAAKARFSINWSVRKVLRDQLAARWPNSLAGYEVNHGIGIDTGQALIVRGGVRNNNDLVSVGASPNVAAKLSDQRQSDDIYITDRVRSRLNDSAKTKLDGRSSIWSRRNSVTVGGTAVIVYGTAYWRKPGATSA